MNYLVLLLAVMFGSGCQFYRQVVVSEDGKLLPWRNHRDNPEAKEQWDEDRLKWEITDAHRRYNAGLMNRYRYNQIRKKHGLEPVR